MKQLIINIGFILVVIVITGIIRMPIEQKLTEELLEKKLIPERVTLENRLALKQKGFTAGLGSFRPTMAAFIDIAASNSHSEQDWVSLEKAYEDILLLDPRNPYYWEIGSWHMISNAAGDSLENEELPYLTRHKLYHKYIDKGEEMLRRSLEKNPDNWKVRILTPRHYSSRHRRPDYNKAADEYMKLSNMENNLDMQRKFHKRLSLYSLNKIKRRHQESYDLALALFKQDELNHVPSLLTSVWVGQNHPLNTVTHKYTLEQIFGSLHKAYKILRIQWKFKNKAEERYGIEQALRKLEKDLRIPQNKRVFPHIPLFMREHK